MSHKFARTTFENRTVNWPRCEACSFTWNKRLYCYPSTLPKNRGLYVRGSGLLRLIASCKNVCDWLRVAEQNMAAVEGTFSDLGSEF
ncbi:hypothetical protein SUGI_0960100 [Cryptomeria japonica]|nr:hypothetical protein SUGI_0960100 [Cryptomeria japonica]